MKFLDADNHKKNEFQIRTRSSAKIIGIVKQKAEIAEEENVMIEKLKRENRNLRKALKAIKQRHENDKIVWTNHSSDQQKTIDNQLRSKAILENENLVLQKKVSDLKMELERKIIN